MAPPPPATRSVATGSLRKMRPLRLCALLAILLSPVFALSRKYDRGPVPLSPKASLHWTLDNAASRISLALVIKDSAVLSGAGKNATWLGLGISEASAGSMIGADIASAEFVSGSLTKCALADRHVPFAAYPLGQTTGNATGVFPEKDTCQDDGSWVLVSCARDPKAGTAALELSRTLAAHDGQDREIGLGIQALIFAYGVKGFKYHGNLRGSAKLTLFNKDGTYPPLKERPLPPKITFRHLVPATNYTVPSENATTYACTTSIVPLPASRKRMLVAVDPVITDKSGKNVVHHLVVYACPPTNYSRRYFKTAWCTDDSPLGSEAGCTAMLFVWAVGIGRFVLPDGVGLQVDATNNHIVMETHYDNPGAAKGIVDTSGVRLYFEDERPIRAGTIALGDPVLSLGGLTVKHDFEYVSSCSSNCTRTWKEPIKVFSSFQHMHTTGRKIFTNHFAANGSFIQPFGSVRQQLFSCLRFSLTYRTLFVLIPSLRSSTGATTTSSTNPSPLPASSAPATN